MEGYSCMVLSAYNTFLTAFINNGFLKWRQVRRKRRIILKCYYVHKIKLAMKGRRAHNQKRSYDWWENIVQQPTFGENQWIENFRMSKKSFMYICNELRQQLSPRPNPVFKEPNMVCSVEKKVAIALYYLASCCEYRVIGNQFGVHKSTVCKIVHEFIFACIKKLTPKHIKMPNEAEAIENASFFEKTSHIPNIIGAIDGTHIPILPPSEGYRDYINRKGWASLVLQAVVNHNYQFMDICIKNPGATHDAAILTTSNIYQNIETILPKGTVYLQGKQLSYIIIGDPAYPLLPWLLKGYTGKVTAIEDSFNVYLNSARVAVEIAFGRLKSRWRCLMKRLDVHHSFVPQVVATCCTLHNIVELHKDNFKENWMKAVQDAEMILEPPKKCINRQKISIEGHNIRTFLTNFLCENYPLRSSVNTQINNQ